jgi:hypothetical protein
MMKLKGIELFLDTFSHELCGMAISFPNHMVAEKWRILKI